MVELYEENIEDWYKSKRDEVSLTEYLCERSGILKADEKGWFLIFNCLNYLNTSNMWIFYIVNLRNLEYIYQLLTLIIF